MRNLSLTLFSEPHGYGGIRKMRKAGDYKGLISALESPQVKRSAKLRFAVVSSLEKLGAPEAVPSISNLLKFDSSESVRCAAAIALGKLHDSTALPALRAALNDESSRVQMWAIRSLGQLRDRDSADCLIGLLGAPDRGLRAYAATALGEIGDQRAIEWLVPLLDDSSSTVRISAEGALDALRYSRG